MFYEPKNGHNLKFNPFNAIVIPRPIGWISTIDSEGKDNLAPYSFFNAVAYVPPQIMFASTGFKPDQTNTKDTVANIRGTKEFCVNVVDYSMLNVMNVSSKTLPKDIDEFSYVGLNKEECVTINCRRVQKTPAALECKLIQIVQMAGEANFVVFGEVTGVHLFDDYIVDGIFDVTKFIPLGRLGYRDYTRVNNSFPLSRPDD